MVNNNYAFIDGQNLHEAVKSFNWWLCYKKLNLILKNKFNVTKAFYFIGYTQPRNCDLYIELRKAGFILSLRKPVNRLENGILKLKANVDSNLITHTLIKISNYDKAVIVAGDGDYYCLSKYLLRNNKLLKIILPSRACSSNLFRNNILGNIFYTLII